MSDDPDFLEKATQSASTLDQLGLMIPGYQGYLKAEHRREADKLQRDHLAKKLDAQRHRVEDLLLRWTEKLRFALLERGQKVMDLSLKLSSSIQNADRGVSGFFSTQEIELQDLEMLYEIDKSLVSHVDGIRELVDALGQGGDDAEIQSKLDAILDALRTLESTFARRKDMLTGVA